MCFRSRDPQVSLESLVQGPTGEPEDVTYTGVKDTARVIAKRFERWPEDA
jgi:hypothetical protein